MSSTENCHLYSISVEPLNNGHVGTSHFVFYKRLSFLWRLKCASIIEKGPQKGPQLCVLYREFIVLNGGTSECVLYREVFLMYPIIQSVHTIRGSTVAILPTDQERGLPPVEESRQKGEVWRRRELGKKVSWVGSQRKEESFFLSQPSASCSVSGLSYHDSGTEGRGEKIPYIALIFHRSLIL